MHFPVSLLKDSPTAMGLISGGLPSFSLFIALNIPPAKNLDTNRGPLPEARRFTISLRVAQIVVGEKNPAHVVYVAGRDLLQCLLRKSIMCTRNQNPVQQK